MTHPDSLPLRVVLIGPECTGKTWLARDLAAHYGVRWSEEYARIFVESACRGVIYSDVESISRGQAALEEEAVAAAIGVGAWLVIHDTDLVSTSVYSRHYFGDCPASVESAAAERVADLYLLHFTDIEWEEEEHQRAEPERREELFERFRSTLTALGAHIAEIRGSWAERRRRAIAAIDTLLSCSDPGYFRRSEPVKQTAKKGDFRK